MSDNKSSAFSTILVGSLFGLPFAGFGVVALYKACEEYQSYNPELEKLLGLLFAGLLFSLIGFGFIVSLIKGWRYEKQIERLKKLHPNEPWRHRPDWAAGKIPCDSKIGVVGVWIITFIWIGLSAPATFAIPEELEKGNHWILVILLFDAVGIYLLFRAVVASMRWYRFGNTVLRLSSPTGEIGGSFEGRIIGNSDVPPNSTFEITLKNINRKTIGSGKNRSVKTTVWYEHVESQSANQGNLRTGVPVTLSIPEDGRPTDSSDSDDEILWEVNVKAEISGADFDVSFVIPVFEKG